jgi:hypothetical protein
MVTTPAFPQGMPCAIPTTCAPGRVYQPLELVLILNNEHSIPFRNVPRALDRPGVPPILERFHEIR